MESDLQWDLLSVNCGSVSLWLFVNHLTLSIKKSNMMLIGSCQKLRNNDLHGTVDSKQLSCVLSVNYLGLHFTYYKYTCSKRSSKGLL